MSLGKVWVDIDGNMEPFDRRLQRAAHDVGRDADGEFKKAGKDIGDVMGGSASDEFGRHGPEFGRKLQEDIRHRPIRVKQKVNVDYDVDSDRLGAEIHDAISHAFSPGGPVDRVGNQLGSAFGDAFGAGFGLSGKSALIPFIVVLVGAIGALIAAAVQAVNALIATLTTLPALILGIGLQVGVLVLAFKGLGTAITGAFAAKNAKELNEALKGLTPSAREFVKTLLPLRDLFSYLKTVTQEAFFKNLGPIVSEIQAALGNTLGFQLDDLAAALGRFARAFGEVFASPSFQQLLDTVIPATIRWLDKFGPGFAAFLTGWIDMANASLPFLEAIGGMLANGLKDLGEWMTKTSKTKGFKQWLEDMQLTLDSVVGLLGAATAFVASFMDALNEQGGQGLIDKIAEAFLILAAFFQSPEGMAGMRGFVTLMALSIQSMAGLVLAIFYIIAAITAFIEWIKSIGPPIADFFGGLSQYWEWAQLSISGAFNTIKANFSAVVNTLKGYWTGFRDAVTGRISDIVAAAKGIPGKILDALSGLYDRMKAAGKAAIQSLIDGILSMAGGVTRAMLEIARRITNPLPGSPAKEGPLSGEGYSMLRGQRLVQDLVKGIKMETPGLRSATSSAVTNITFGAGSVSVGFQGVVPTPEQARVTGAAAGQGILGQLAIRDTRLAVRTL